MKLSDHEQVVLKAIEHVAGSRNGLASVPAVTRAVGFPISTTQKILAALHRKEIIALHHHDYPAQMSADEKKRAVKIGNDYFHAVAIRNPATMSADPKEYVLQHRAVGTATGWLNYGVYYENEMEAARKDAKRFDHARLIDGDTEYSKTPKVIFEVKHNPAGNMKRGAAKKNPSPAQLKARAAFTRMAKERAKAAKKANPRARNKAATVSAADIAKMPAHVQAKLRGDLAKVEAKEAKATTPTQKAAAVKARRSFLSRLGTRLRVIGQTKKFKVSARNLNKAPRKTIKIRARHETDAIAKAQAKLGGGFDQFKVQNTVRHRVGNPTFTITATEKGVHLGSFQDKTKTAALKRAKQAYGHRYAGIKATAKNPTAAMQYFLDELNEMDWKKPRIGRINSLIDAALDAGISPAKLKLQLGKQIGKANAIKIVNARIYARNPKRNGIAKTAGKAIKKVTRAVLGGVSKVAGKGAKALKNPRRRNAGAFDYYLGAIKKRSISPAQKEHFIQSIGWELSHRTPIQVQRELIKSGMTRKSAGAAVRRAQTIDRLDRQGVGDLRERAERKARGKDPRRKKTKKNPSASAIRKKFAGRVSGSRELYFPKGAPQGMAKLGRLVSIKLKGGKLIKPSRRNPSAEIWLCSDTSGKLWLGCTKVGPLYAGAPGDLGEMSMLEYSESKPHIGYPAQTIWFHKMGEVSGRRPHLIVNDDQDLLIKGGNYKITRAGIVD